MIESDPDELDPDDFDPDFEPEQWELLTDQFMLMIGNMLDEGFELPQVMAALSFTIADLGQQIIDGPKD